MAATILIESYLMAFGLAVTMGESEDEAHLFARNYDCPVTYTMLKKDYSVFVDRRSQLQRCNHQHQVGTINPDTGENKYIEFKEFDAARRLVDFLRENNIPAWHSMKDCQCR